MSETTTAPAVPCDRHAGALVRQLPMSHPGVGQYSLRCRYCGGTTGYEGDCVCSPDGSGYPRSPRDADYATRCAACDHAVKAGRQIDFQGNAIWEHIWPAADRDHRAELNVTDEVRAAWAADDCGGEQEEASA